MISSRDGDIISNCWPFAKIQNILQRCAQSVPTLQPFFQQKQKQRSRILTVATAGLRILIARTTTVLILLISLALDGVLLRIAPVHFVNVHLVQILKMLANRLQFLFFDPYEVGGFMLKLQTFLRFSTVLPKIVHLLPQ
jgi:hypothetical protein